jgi:opacity protein-like surface antigen
MAADAGQVLRRIAQFISRRSRPAAAFAAVLVTASAAGAQGSGDGFLFQRPVGSLTARGGYAMPSGGSDIFSFARENLTLGKRDFDAPSFGFDLAFRLTRRIDIVFSGDRAFRSKKSEFRDWVDEGATTSDSDDLPIVQTSTLKRVPLTVNAKYYLRDVGQSIGRFAWIPSRFAPYAMVGGGVTWHQFAQDGRFVDFETNRIFYDRFVSEGWARTAQAAAGVDYSLAGRWAVTTEGRYIRASAPMGIDFYDFNPIDLSGFTANVGLTVRF